MKINLISDVFYHLVFVKNDDLHTVFDAKEIIV